MIHCTQYWVFIILEILAISSFIWGLIVIGRNSELGGILLFVSIMYLVLGSIITWGAIGSESIVQTTSLSIDKSELKIHSNPINTTLVYRGVSQVTISTEEIEVLKDTAVLYFYLQKELNMYKEKLSENIIFRFEPIHELKEN